MKVLEAKKPQGMTELHWRVLAGIPSGRENAIPISYLMERLAINKNERRKVNYIINDLIFTYGYPLGTSSEQGTKGIFLIEDEDDLSLACHTLNSRAMGALKRHKKLIENYNKRNQLQLDF